jgi:uncharacterized Fe-S cluster protein YjdI
VANKREYTNGELTIVWEPEKCFHSGKCVKGLPEVFKPKEKPWVQMENSDTENLIITVKKCPSGALNYYMKDNLKSNSMNETTKIEVVENGPLLVHGNCNVNTPDGNTETKENRTAFCRCGASSNKPYCDGAHRKIEFKG